MKKLIAAALALSFAAPSLGQSLEVAGGDWSSIPLISSEGKTRVGSEAVTRVEEIIASGACKVPGQSKNRIDLTVPFLMQFDASGAATRVIVSKMDCVPLESMLGTVALAMVKAGDFKPTGENPAGWYRSQLSFASSR